ncbi:MAG: Mur ligase domain-containing protein, partial [Bellilinea sp.]
MPTTLDKIFAQIPIDVHDPDVLPPVSISGIALDSRGVQPGDLFIALVGGTADGHRYIPSAVERGAAAVVGQQPA